MPPGPAGPSLRVGIGGESRDFAPQTTVTIGRDQACTLVLAHGDVSRRHAELRHERGSWWVVDLGSTNGTLVDGQRVGELALAPGRSVDVLVGGTRGVPLRVQVGAGPAAPAAPPPYAAPGRPPQQAPQQAPQQTPRGARPPAHQPPPFQPHQPPADDRTMAAGAPAAFAGGAGGPGHGPRHGGAAARTAPPGQFAHGQPLLRGPVVAGRTFTIGRAQGCDVVLDDPLVSRRHAAIELGRAAVLRDLGSFNGTYVNGSRLQGGVGLSPGDEVIVGNQTFTWTGGQLLARNTRSDLTLVVEGLTTVVKGGRRLLDGVSLELGPASLTAVIGPSGSGKSTMLGALTGTRPATYGNVIWQGHDLYAHYDQLRHQIGLVPQQDIQHPQLTVRQGLSYAARLRLPPDTGSAERAQRVEQVVGQMQLGRQVDNRIGTQLSGGQKKRVSIATELLTAPPLLFLDEPTSGLDPGLDRDVMHLLRGLADEGRVVVVVTHSVLALDVCDKVVVMAPGGRIAYAGPPDEVLAHFGCSDYPEVFDLLDEPDLWRRIPPPPGGRAATGALPVVANAALPSPPRQSFARQFGTLVRRTLSVIASDKMLLALLLLTPPAIGGLSRLAQGGDGFALARTADDNGLLRPGEVVQRLTVFIVAAALIGAVMTVWALVNERAVFRREYAVGLSPGVYLTSKVAVFGVLCFLQGVVVTFVGTVGLPGPDDGGVVGLGWFEVAIAVGLVCTAVAVLCLAISALLTSSEQGMPALIGVVMTQLVFSGAIISVAGRAVLEQLAWLAPARWGYAASAATVDLNRSKEGADGALLEGEERDVLYTPDVDQWVLNLFVLVLLTLAFVVLGYLTVRRSARAPE
ncbi:FHA domain-containing protein [Nocardioides sp. ChNu-153]|uniref:FHA domain-containing protein n=1 Tax=Nocardioides sp. ChNu-153 TaxID=2779364 RepID=UPI00264DECC8|nr:FHA domain-containing protein [Nocardioides sp. ChNu-153]MDN7120452.1 FHA domain-containing protein [Nocardioides sp. ChNu-153]